MKSNTHYQDLLNEKLKFIDEKLSEIIGEHSGEVVESLIDDALLKSYSWSVKNDYNLETVFYKVFYKKELIGLFNLKS